MSLAFDVARLRCRSPSMSLAAACWSAACWSAALASMSLAFDVARRCPGSAVARLRCRSPSMSLAAALAPLSWLRCPGPGSAALVLAPLSWLRCPGSAVLAPRSALQAPGGPRAESGHRINGLRHPARDSGPSAAQVMASALFLSNNPVKNDMD